MNLAWAAVGLYLLIVAVIAVAIRWNRQRHRPVWDYDHTKVIGQITAVRQDASGITVETQMDRGPEWDVIENGVLSGLSIGRHYSNPSPPSVRAVLDLDALSAEELGRWVRAPERHAEYKTEERIEQERLRSRSWLHAMRAVMGAEAAAWEAAAKGPLLTEPEVELERDPDFGP